MSLFLSMVGNPIFLICVQVVQEQPQPVQEEPQQQQQLQQQSEEGGQGQQQETAPTTLEELQQALSSGQAILQTTDNGSEQTLQMVEGQCKALSPFSPLEFI